MIIERALTEEERQELNNRIIAFDKRRRGYIKYVLAYEVIVSLVAIYIYNQMDKEWMWLFIFSVVAFVGIGLWGTYDNIKTNNHFRKRQQEYLLADTVVSILVTVDKYYASDEIDDEGEYYIFQLPDNKLLSIIDIGFFEFESFPGSNFELTVLKNERGEVDFFNVEVYGETPLPHKSITGKAKEAFYNSRFCPDNDTYAIVDGNLDDVDKALT